MVKQRQSLKQELREFKANNDSNRPRMTVFVTL